MSHRSFARYLTTYKSLASVDEPEKYVRSRKKLSNLAVQALSWFSFNLLYNRSIKLTQENRELLLPHKRILLGLASRKRTVETRRNLLSINLLKLLLHVYETLTNT
jgi:hypothetical protein